MTYEGNRTLDEIADDLRNAQRVCLLTHAKPDGDAIGSTIALHRTLREMGTDSVVVYLAYYPERFDSILRAGDAVLLDPDETGEALNDERCQNADRVVICDTGARQQLKAALDYLEPRTDITTIIDHHRSGDADLAHARHIDTSASAACVLIAELCTKLLGTGSPAQLREPIAQPLYLGTATDTGWFRHTNTDARTLRLAADLIEAGVNADALVQMTEMGDPPQRLELLKRALNSTHLFADNRAAIIALRAQDLEDAGVDPGDTGGLVDIPRSISTVRAVALLVEQNNGLVKVSMRSKGGDNAVNVSALANALGGGGHIHAAGARVEGTLDYAKTLVERLITDALDAPAPSP